MGFDQKGQRVEGNQTNVEGDLYQAGGDVNFGAVRSGADVAKMFEALLAALDRATQSGEVEAETAVVVEGALKKGALEAKKAEPDKQKVLGFLSSAKKALGDMSGAAASAVKLAPLLGEACATIERVL